MKILDLSFDSSDYSDNSLSSESYDSSYEEEDIDEIEIEDIDEIEIEDIDEIEIEDEEENEDMDEDDVEDEEIIYVDEDDEGLDEEDDETGSTSEAEDNTYDFDLNKSEYENDLAFMKRFVISIKRANVKKFINSPYKRRLLANKIVFNYADRLKFIGLLRKYVKETFYIKFRPYQYYGYLIRDMQLFDEAEIIGKGIKDINSLLCKESKYNIYGKIYKYGSSSNKSDEYSVEWLFKLGNVKLLDPDLIKAYKHFDKDI